MGEMKKLSIFMMVLLFGVYFLFPLSSYASEDFHWECENGNWFYRNSNGNAKKGRFCDENGDIYDTGSNTDGHILISSYSTNYQYFDENGRLKNTCMHNNMDYESLAKKYENHHKLTFSNEAEFKNFLNYYLLQYQMYNNNSFPVYFCRNSNDGSYSTTLGNQANYNRNITISSVLQKFGRLSVGNPYAQVNEACLKASSMEYDVSSYNVSLQDSLKSNKGVCWHYSKIASILLNDAGVYTEIMTGNYKAIDGSIGLHMWIRCLINGKWVYADPTLYSQFPSFYNISYDILMDRYFCETFF